MWTAANPAPSPVSPLQSQFVFIYDALAEFHSCGDTSIAARDLGKELKRLESSGEKGQTGYQEQFEVSGWGGVGQIHALGVDADNSLSLHPQKLSSVSPKADSMEFTVAENPANKGKNRSLTALPRKCFMKHSHRTLTPHTHTHTPQH